MGVCKIVDAILFVFFLMFTFTAVLFDAQSCLPSHFFPDFLVEVNNWYAHEYADYLVTDKPHFIVGLIALELVVLWPLSIANLYGILAKKSWYNTSCLIQGVSGFTSMVAVLSELIGSKKASFKLFMAYLPFLGISLLAILRGLIPISTKNTSSYDVKKIS